MDFGPYSVALANNAGDIVATIPHDNDGNTWDTVKAATVHIGTRIGGGTGRVFILDCDGEIVSEIAGDSQSQTAAHDAYDAYMSPERAERAAAGRARIQARLEIARLDRLYLAS